MQEYTLSEAFASAQTVDIPAFGGKLDVSWNPGSQVTQWGGLAYFVSYLKTSGLFDRLVEDAPFRYRSPNAPKVRDVVGTADLAIVCCFSRYVHVNRLRNDAVLAALLGLGRIVCEDSVRRALKSAGADRSAFRRAWTSSRGDCANSFDEYKNQYGWGGFVTKDLKPCRAMARLIAIVANWWNVFCRLADGDRHLESTTSRPMYMGVVGRLVVSGRRRLLRLTSTHLKAGEIQDSLTRIGEFMGRISAIAEQLDFNRVWELTVRAAFRKWLGGSRPRALLPKPLAAIGRETPKLKAKTAPESTEAVAGPLPQAAIRVIQLPNLGSNICIRASMPIPCRSS